MNKHLLMLSAAVAALLAQQAQAATTISTVGTSAINTKTDGDITINSGGGVKISKAGAAVTVNSNNFLNNGGTISNTNTDGAKGILIDASGGTITSPTGVSSSGTIDLTGSGGTKSAIELSGGAFTGPITLTSASVIKVAGDSSSGVAIDAGSTLNGDMTLSGTMTVAPTNLTALTNSAPPTLVNIAGTVNGNVIFDGSTTFSGVGQNTRGILVGPTGSINACNAVAVPGCTEIGTLTNSGNISLVGAALTQGSNNKNVHPEAGSALIVSGNVAGGIVNGGPTSINDATAAATLSSSGIVTAGGGTVPVVEIGPSGGVATSAITIGIDTADAVDAGASFINRGNIVASPLNANNSTLAVQVVGSSGFVTTLTGNFVDAGTITAIATSATGSSAAAPVATALAFSPFSSTKKIIVSGESAGTPASANGTINATVTGTQGGTAQAVFIDQNAVVPEIDVRTNAKIRATNNVTAPTTATIADATAIRDASNTLALINNAGTISATATTLTPNANVTVSSNFSHAIDVSASTIPVTINNAGTITGDVLLNSSGNGTVLNVGGGTATGGSAGQQTAAANTATATGVTNSLNNLASVTGAVAFGTGQSTLNVNDFGFVSGQVTSANGTLDVNVAQHGTLDLTNATANLVANTFNINGGTASLSVSENLRSLGQATVAAKTSATVAHGSSLGVTINSFVPQGQNSYVLISSPTGTLSVPDFAVYQSSLITNLPFFFDKTPGASNLLLNPPGAATDELVLVLTPKTSTQLGLTGDAAKIFPFANAALLKDNTLGAAVVNGITDTTSAQRVYSQFTPDVSGNVRAEVIGITDSATGPVSARQRLLRSYADQGGDFTLWGQEFAQYINNKGSSGGGITQSKSHGFGFVLGGDGGDPDDGWYGGAFSFFAGDATQSLPNNSKNQTEWYQLTGYTDWRGPHMFLDTHLDVGYGSLRGKRFLTINIPVAGTNSTATLSREADGKRAGLLGAFGVTTGATFNWGDTVLMPTLGLDGMSMREEGYTEVGGGNGFDLKVNPYYADSLRAFLGMDVRQDIDLGDFTLQPEGRLGYRYDFLNGAVKIRGAFLSDPNNPFTLTGPDPSRGNVVAGATLAASTDTWSMGLNFDWVRGSHGSTTEVGTVSLLGRI